MVKGIVDVDCKATGSCGHLAWGTHTLKTGGMILPAENEGEETPLPFPLPEFRPPPRSVHARASSLNYTMFPGEPESTSEIQS